MLIRSCVLISLFYGFLCSGCSPVNQNNEEQILVQKIKDLAAGNMHAAHRSSTDDVNQGVYFTIELNKITPFEWDTACASWAYEDFDDFKKRVGVDNVEFQQQQKWRGSESIVRLVFIKENRSEKVIRLMRGRDADFDPSSLNEMGNCLSKQNANISAKKNAADSGLPPVFLIVFENR